MYDVFITIETFQNQDLWMMGLATSCVTNYFDCMNIHNKNLRGFLDQCIGNCGHFGLTNMVVTDELY